MSLNDTWTKLLVSSLLRQFLLFKWISCDISWDFMYQTVFNNILWFKWYLNEIKWFNSGKSCPFSPWTEKNETGTEQYINGIEKIEWELNDVWME